MADTLPTLLRRAQALCDGDERLCAHIAIYDAAYSPETRHSGVNAWSALMAVACAADVEITGEGTRRLKPLYDKWDASTPAERQAIWERAIAASEGGN